MKSRFWPHVFVLCALLLPGAAGMEARAEPGVMDSQADSSPAPASGSVLNANNWEPVTSGGPFGVTFWRDASYYATIHSGDIDGDGIDELLARGKTGMQAWRFNGTYWDLVADGGPFPNATGWDAEQYYATIHSGDIDGDGIDELLGRAGAGMEVWRFNGTSWDLVADGGPFSDADGWDEAQYYATIHSGDIDGDGSDELLGRAGAGMEAWRFNGTSWDLVADGGPFPNATDWDQAKYYTTIHSGDIDGDGIDELLGRAGAGMEAWRFNGTSWDLVADGGPFPDAGGWDQARYYATIHSGDIDDDGIDELLGRGWGGMVAYRFHGTSWDLVADGGPFPDAGGWDQAKYYLTIHSSDIDGDGIDELLGRADDGMQAWRLAPYRVFLPCLSKAGSGAAALPSE